MNHFSTRLASPARLVARLLTPLNWKHAAVSIGVALAATAVPAVGGGTLSAPVMSALGGPAVERAFAQPDALVLAGSRDLDHFGVMVSWTSSDETTPVENSETETSAPAPAVGAFPIREARNSQETFIFGLVAGAQESQRVTRVPASVTIAQGILESGWGRSKLSREAHNYFGVKAQTREGTAGVVWMETWEVEGGSNVMRTEPFRRYHNVAESLVDHGYFFVENRRYAQALEVAHDPRAFARLINAAGYATDPAYAPKLISLMDTYDLYQYDLI